MPENSISCKLSVAIIFCFKKIKIWYKCHERHITTGAFVLGFVIDNFTLTRIDRLFDNMVLVSYLLIALLGIVGYSLYENKVVNWRFLTAVGRFLPLFVQFAFGGLFSGFMIFYTRSASIIESWPFLIVLAVLLFGNEFFRKYYLRFSFQISLFFFALFSYLIFFVPIVIGEIGPHIFILSGILSVLIIIIIIRILALFIESKIQKSKRALIVNIASVFVAINVLYFANIIPPIPLSLKHADIYHFVERTVAGEYYVKKEKDLWCDTFRINNIVNLRQGRPVFVFSSVFAPTDLNTQIYHIWQYYDESKNQWITASKIGFRITGGRDMGYRGYSKKYNVFPGKWRVNIATEKGRLIGRVKFKIYNTQITPVLETEIR